MKMMKLMNCAENKLNNTDYSEKVNQGGIDETERD